MQFINTWHIEIRPAIKENTAHVVAACRNILLL